MEPTVVGMIRAADDRRIVMAEPIPAGSDVSAGTYACTYCSYQLELQSTKPLPPCPVCGNGEWRTRGGGSVPDPQPARDG
jgi:hypothetical protein